MAVAKDRRVLVHVKPEYPPIARRMKIAGTVLLNVVVTPAGNVKAANFVMGEKVLLEAAQVAILKWKFEPADEQTFEDIEINFPLGVQE
jgi:TonB family protein